jgi:glycosyltransferase involved in cell wall biosynthesis
MRVLHVNAGNLYGGIETLLLTLARQRALCTDMEPSFALCFEGRLSDELRAADVPVHVLGSVRMSRPWTLQRARKRLHDLLWTEAIDLVVTHGCWPHALAAPVVRRAAKPLVFWAHGMPSGRHWLEWWARRSRPDLALANSHATRQAVQAHLFPGCREEVVYLPVERSESAAHVADRSQVRADLGCAENDVVIVAACRLDPYKGHAVLVEALGKLRNSVGWRAWVAGGVQQPKDRQMLAALEARTVALGVSDRVRFLGQRNDVPRLLAAADIHCQPNVGPEPFGIAFVEALYAGLPVVTSALGGALEIVDSTCGILVPPGDADRLAAALSELVANGERRRQLGAAGPDRAAQFCDPATQMEQIGRSLLQTSRPSQAGYSAGSPAPAAIDQEATCRRL